MTLPHFNLQTGTVYTLTNNAGIYCSFIDGNDTDYDEVSRNINKLSTNYIELYINTINDELIVIEQIFNLLNKNPTMIVHYESMNEPQKIIGEIWFKGFKITHIEGLFTFDYNANISSDVTSTSTGYIDTTRRVKLYYEYENIEFMKTDAMTIRKNKLNRLMDKEGNRHIIDSKMIK